MIFSHYISHYTHYITIWHFIRQPKLLFLRQLKLSKQQMTKVQVTLTFSIILTTFDNSADLFPPLS